MNVEVSVEEIDSLIESLTYSLRAVTDARGTPADVRRQNVARIEALLAKLRAYRLGGAA